jgi:hypothetical protein
MPFSTILALAALLPGQATVTDFSQDFRDGGPLSPSLDLFGPNAAEFVRPEKGGLRITPPTEGRQTQGWGVVAQFALSGDFVVTARYELLAADRPTRGGGAGVAINVLLDAARTKFAKVGRFVRVREGDVYVAESMIKKEPDGDYTFQMAATEARTGRLRLAREGSILHFLAADGNSDEFRKINQVEFGAEDLGFVRVVVNNNSSPTALDARLVDWKIRSGNLVGAPSPEDPSAAGLPIALLVGLGLTFCLALLGIWLYARHRRGRKTIPGAAVGEQLTPQAPAVSIQCSGCSKNLKARAALAGKKVKCPECGEEILIP